MNRDVTPKVVFVITSQGRDFYSAMLRVAIVSLRATNPFVTIVVVCDPLTEINLKKYKDPVISQLDLLIVMDTPSGSDSFKSRFLKTTLRSVVDGPFLFLDVDVFVRGSLADIFLINADISAAYNHSMKHFNHQIWAHDLSTLKGLRWLSEESMYFNSGVVFFNDTPAAKKFVVEWHRLWQESLNYSGRHEDQPAFYRAIHETGIDILAMSDRYNAQFKFNPSVSEGAIIWHYYASLNKKPTTYIEKLVCQLMDGSDIDNKVIKHIINSDNPWFCNNMIDRLAAKYVIHNGWTNGWQTFWLRRERSIFFSQRFKRLFGN